MFSPAVTTRNVWGMPVLGGSPSRLKPRENGSHEMIARGLQILSGYGLWLTHSLYNMLHSPRTWANLKASSSKLSVSPGYHLNSTLPGFRGLPKKHILNCWPPAPCGCICRHEKKVLCRLLKLGWGVRIEPQSSMNGAHVRRLILMQTQGREISHEDADTPTWAEACEVETGLALCCRKASA